MLAANQQCLWTALLAPRFSCMTCKRMRSEHIWAIFALFYLHSVNSVLAYTGAAMCNYEATKVSPCARCTGSLNTLGRVS